MVETIHVVKEFYALEALKVLVSQRIEFGKKSQEKLCEDIKSFSDKYVANLANALYDYTALVAFGEMRHAKNQCYSYNVQVPHHSNRGVSYGEAVNFNPTSILIAGNNLFTRNFWGSSFGGLKWGLICDRVLLKDKISNQTFCDMCFSLSHNNSNYLDKEQSKIFSIQSRDKYTDILNFKFECRDLEELIEYCLKSVGSQLMKLLKRARTLNLLDFKTDNRFNRYVELTNLQEEHMDWCEKEFMKKNKFDNVEYIENFILEYAPIKWGDNWLSSKTKEGNSYVNSQIDFLTSRKLPISKELKERQLKLQSKMTKKEKVQSSYKIGDKIVMNKDYDCKGIKGETGTIIANDGYTLGVKFDLFMNGHDLAGKCEGGYGYNVPSECTSPINFMSCNFNIGDEIKVIRSDIKYLFTKGKIGKIAYISKNKCSYGVIFSDFVSGNTLWGKCESGYGLNLSIASIEKVEKKEKVIVSEIKAEDLATFNIKRVTFKIGDKVSVITPRKGTKEGIVIGINGSFVSVKFEKHSSYQHSCGGKCAHGYGYNYLKKNLLLILKDNEKGVA